MHGVGQRRGTSPYGTRGAEVVVVVVGREVVVVVDGRGTVVVGRAVVGGMVWRRSGSGGDVVGVVVGKT